MTKYARNYLKTLLTIAVSTYWSLHTTLFCKSNLEINMVFFRQSLINRIAGWEMTRSYNMSRFFTHFTLYINSLLLSEFIWTNQRVLESCQITWFSYDNRFVSRHLPWKECARFSHKKLVLVLQQQRWDAKYSTVYRPSFFRELNTSLFCCSLWFLLNYCSLSFCNIIYT